MEEDNIKRSRTCQTRCGRQRPAAFFKRLEEEAFLPVSGRGRAENASHRVSVPPSAGHVWDNRPSLPFRILGDGPWLVSGFAFTAVFRTPVVEDALMRKGKIPDQWESDAKNNQINEI